MFEAVVVGYMAVGLLVWILAIYAEWIRTKAAMSPFLALFGLVLMVSSWPFMPWSALRGDLKTAWKGKEVL